MNRPRTDNPTALPARPAWRRGFTLVEILVVIAIISVLTAMVISVSSALRQNQDEKVTRQDVKLLYNQVEAYRETYGQYPREWTADDPNGPGTWNDSMTNPVRDAKRNCAWLIIQLERDRNTRTVLRESFPTDRYKKDDDPPDPYDFDGDGEGDVVYVMDGFGRTKDDYRAFNYLRSGGAGGAPLVYSAGPDHNYDDPADNVRSDDLNDQ